MNQNKITQLQLETRTCDLKQQGKSEREIARLLSIETGQNICKAAVHRCLMKQLEPVRATIEPPQTHQPVIEPEPQHSDTSLQESSTSSQERTNNEPILMFRRSVELYLGLWEQEHSFVTISNLLRFCDDYFHHCWGSTNVAVTENFR